MKNYKLFFLAIILLISACSKDEDDQINQNFNNVNEKIKVSPLDEISQDSELFKNLLQITKDEQRPDLNITCIDFIYPLSIFVFDENDEFSSLNAVLDDEEFSELLESLQVNFSISVSFPIVATLESGENFTINTVEELKESIDNCLDEEIIRECNGFLEDCLLKIGFSFEYENTYLGGIFEESNGFTSFDFEDESYIGSWTALLIEDELYININLVEADTEITEFFNHNWLVEYIDENSLKLANADRELILNKRCDLDFDLCTNFFYEVCENEIGIGVSDFILNDYKFCILDTLELNETSVISFHETFEDAENNLNAIASDQVYNNYENNQSIFVKIIDQDNMASYIVEIILVSVSC